MFNHTFYLRVCLFCVLAAFTIHSMAQTKAKKPNVIILLADDMTAKTIQSLGNKEIITPNLDQLVKDGVAFTKAYNMGGRTGAVCVASRAMIMTGQSIHNLTSTETQMPEKSTLLGELLQKSGYQSYGIGKWHNGVESYSRSFNNGAEIMFGGMTNSQWQVPLNHYRKDGSYRQVDVNSAETNKELPQTGDHLYKGKHSAEIFSDAAINFLNSKESKKPFFLYVAYTTPHDPRQMPKEFMQLYDKRTISLPPNLLPEHPFDNGHMKGRDERLLGFPRKPEEVRKEMKDYYATITHLDFQIGRIIKALKKTGKYENTIIIFAADNGLAIGQHGLMGKQNLYEHTVGIPMIWCGPGIPKNKTSSSFTYLTDIYPTLCEMLKINKPETLTGNSFLPILRNPNKIIYDRVYFSFRDLQRAVRGPRFKLIEYHVKDKRTTQLFDLLNDPWEQHNLAEQPMYKDTVAKYRSELLQYKEKWKDVSPFWNGF